ncbi:uncharacterized protein LOC117107118 [Anneissia japonica]|uniref:uncharacterized protein LOC117107118 n=1 Tax=Anneissia japonica TaxID=1529436 RepID=UPI0014258EC7|nr:uncharacterized protein LOC117107118 [Anneissia japonica]
MDLDGSQWISPKTQMTHNIRLFFFGDYDFLCRIYGLVGPNGKYSCIYCFCSQDDIRSNHPRKGLRCLKSYNQDYKCFVDHGEDRKKSKTISHSVIRPYMVDIELDRVGIVY